MMLHPCLQVRNVFTGLFLASIGLVISPVFIYEHIRWLSIGAAVVLLAKGALITLVVWNFRISWHTSVVVGVSLAQARASLQLLSECCAATSCACARVVHCLSPSLPRVC